MRRVFALFLLFSFCLAAEEEKLSPNNVYVEDIISDLRHTLVEKGIKIFTAENPLASTDVSIKELTVDLRNPTFCNGILLTREGGVIKSPDMRIQARTIQYIKKTENGVQVHRIEAEGDLMMIYKDRVFVGDELEYDFIKKVGTIYNGKTFASPWYLGGDKIDLKSDGSYKIDNVFITTCESSDSAWDLHAGTLEVEKKDLLKAKNVRFRLFKFPTLWLPSFKINLMKFFSKPIIRYKLNYDKASGPRVSIRYQAYSWKDWAFFLRLDYRLKMGFGGALETEYQPTHKRSSFVTRSYIAEDMIPKDLKKRRRYRLQGVYQGKSIDNKTTAFLTWDKYSDIKMPGDFKCDDFELSTAKKTEFLFRQSKKNLISIIHARPRANSFETIKQDIPTIYVNVRPLKIDSLGMIFSNWGKLSYLDYAYSDEISPSLPNIHSFRAETRQELIWPINMKGVVINPKAGFIGIVYSNSPDSKPKWIASFLYGGRVHTDLYHDFSRYQHIIEPYVEFKGLSDPTVHVDDHYIFSINDGYHRLNMLKIGLSNQFFSKRKIKPKPTFEFDIFTNCFLGEDETVIPFPRMYLDLAWNLPSLSIISQNGWNFSKHALDYSKIRLGWTVSEDIAFGVEFRYRSSFDWRKADHENFILDVTRSENELLHSPLSDKRCAVLSHIFLRLSPFWNCHIESHHGWDRTNEPHYNEFKIEFFTMLSSSWKFKITYEHTQTDDRVSFNYFLLKL